MVGIDDQSEQQPGMAWVSCLPERGARGYSPRQHLRATGTGLPWVGPTTLVHKPDFRSPVIVRDSAGKETK